ncbi:polyprenyl synthetase family protein [Pelagibacteraceae bacterium]|nr:polyprenyl synthetase family protein [Pelagibacteraceae bacterium]|tara:strand:- start:2072 stop:2947 length:876 start_codon:yes stop_codon:yes gene_type:complete
MEKKLLNKNAKMTDIFLKKYLDKQAYSDLVLPMKYGVLSGGKKIRSSVVLGAGKLFNINKVKLLNVCAAVECIHSYSLIHDDLPCMDDDKMRRGKPATHIKYGESTAILAGNSLLTLAFEMIVDKNYKIENKAKIKLVKSLGYCSGHVGIAGGQFLDLNFEKKRKRFSDILDMQIKKTGKLFNFCCYAAGVIAKKNDKELKSLSKLGEDIGLLFQFADDFIDIKGSKKLAGKSIKKDKKKGKSTLVALIGYEKAYSYASKLKKNILSKLSKHGKKADNLINTVEFILERNF